METLCNIRREFYVEDLTNLEDVKEKFFKLAESLSEELNSKDKLNALHFFKTQMFIEYSSALRNK